MPQADLDRRVRTLLQLVRGVESVDVRMGSRGIEAIEIDAASGEPARRIVRDVESALLTGLGIQVDHRAIRIHQNGTAGLGRNGEPGQGLSPEARFLHYEGSDRGAFERALLTRVHCEPDGELYCDVRIEIEADGERHAATVRDADTRHARSMAAARATLGSLQGTLERETAFSLEGVEEFEICEMPAILASVHAKRGRETKSLLGAALLDRGPEDAAARAVLDALNRYWSAQEHTAPS